MNKASALKFFQLIHTTSALIKTSERKEAGLIHLGKFLTKNALGSEQLSVEELSMLLYCEISIKCWTFQLLNRATFSPLNPRNCATFFYCNRTCFGTEMCLQTYWVKIRQSWGFWITFLICVCKVESNHCGKYVRVWTLHELQRSMTPNKSFSVAA